MASRVVLRLLRIALAVLLVALVVQHVGPAVSARSMQGYASAYDSAAAGRPDDAAAVGDRLAHEWQSLGRTVDGAMRFVERAARAVLPTG